MPVKPRILYVDDDHANCQLMTYILDTDGGYDVATAEDGHEALKKINSEFFDLYLLDYCLPDITGIELCRHIRAKRSTAPIIIYSALDRDVDRDRAYKAGANEYLVKPDDLEKIKPKLERLLKQPANGNTAEGTGRAEPVRSTSHVSSRRKNAGIM